MCDSTMHRGRGGNQSHCNGRGAREYVKKPLCADEESRGHGRNKPEKLMWKSSRSKGNNLVVTSNLAAGKHKRILVIREQSPNVVSQEGAGLDLGVVNNVIAFLSCLQQVPRGLGTRGIHNVLAKPDVQGRARAVLSSLHDECKKKLQRNDSVRGLIEGDFGSSFSCRISRGPALSHSLEWPGRHKQLQNQISAGISSHSPHFAANRISGSSFSLPQAATSGEPWQWGARSDIQQRQPYGWWRRTLFGSLAGAAGIRMMSFKFSWLLLPELFSLAWFRRNRRQKHKERLERRNWWHLPVKVATTISSRVYGSLSNSVVAANLLLLIFELRSMIDSERSADSDLTMLNGRIQGGRRCCSCLASCNQGGTCVELNKHSRPCETCCVNSCGEFDYAFMDDKLPLNWREDIAHLLALLPKGRVEKDDSAGVTSKDDIGHLAELIHAVLSMPKHYLEKLLHAELPAPAPALEGRTHLSEEKGLICLKTEEVDVGDQKQDSEETRPQDAVPQRHLNHSTSAESLICPSSLERNLVVSRAASASSLQCLGLGSLQNLAGVSPDMIIGGLLPSQEDAAGEKIAESCLSLDDISGGKLDWRASCGQEDSQVSISFVSKDFPEGKELVVPQHTTIKENESCLAAATTDPQNQSTQAASASFVGHPDACENSDFLRSILLEKHNTGLHSCKSSVCGASDVESEYFFETSSMSLPDLEHSGYQQTHEQDMKPENLEKWKITHSDALSIHEDDHALTQETNPAHCKQNSFNSDYLDDQVVELQSGEESLQTLSRVDAGLKCRPCPLSMIADCVDEMTPASTSAPLHFADHPTCISLRKRRHEYVDQNYLTPDVLNTARWRELVFWHGHCRQGNPTLCIFLGKAVQKLPARELQTISSVIISQMEYAELNFFKGSVKQMNIIMDLWGIGLMRMPPLEILSRVGMIMNRDYAGRGGSIFLVNAPMMLSLVIGAMKRVILRPGYNKGAMIEKGFLENKDRILFFNRNYKRALQEHFQLTSLPSMLGGKCKSKVCPEDCDVGSH